MLIDDLNMILWFEIKRRLFPPLFDFNVSTIIWADRRIRSWGKAGEENSIPEQAGLLWFRDLAGEKRRRRGRKGEKEGQGGKTRRGERRACTEGSEMLEKELQRARARVASALHVNVFDAPQPT